MHYIIFVMLCILLTSSLLIQAVRPYVRKRVYAPATARWARAVQILLVGLLSIMALLHLVCPPVQRPLLWGYPAFIWCGILFVFWMFIRTVHFLTEEIHSRRSRVAPEANHEQAKVPR